MKLKYAALILALAAGFAAALALSLPPTASAWDISLPAGFTVTAHGSDAPSCMEFYKVNAPDGTPSGELCSQADVDAFVAAHQPPPTSSTTTTTPTSTVTSTSSEATTTTATVTTTTTTTATSTTTAAPPTASFTSAATGLAVAFTDTSTAVAPATVKTISWHFGDGENAVGTSPTHAYTTAGTFTVVEIVTDTNGLTDQATVNISVSPFGGSKKLAETASSALSTATSASFSQQVGVFCVRSWGAVKPERGYGLSIVGSRQANIWQAGCAALTSRKGPVALALLVLGHETAHALGVKPELAADCYALKRLPVLERALAITDHGYRTQAAAIVKRQNGRGCRSR